jgi:hypothetical protein
MQAALLLIVYIAQLYWVKVYLIKLSFFIFIIIRNFIYLFIFSFTFNFIRGYLAF